MVIEVAPDADLIQLVEARQEEALVELHRRYAPYLAAVARRILHDPDEVEQCVQDAFVKIWDYAANYDANKAAVKTWLVTICHRQALNRVRGGKLETQPLQQWDAPQRDPDPLDRMLIEDALKVLTGEERELIELAFYQGYSHGQVADVTERPLGTVKSKLRGALTKLRKLLKGGEANE